jgi:NitT/TauT family transport system substrate-binding protein
MKIFKQVLLSIPLALALSCSAFAQSKPPVKLLVAHQAFSTDGPIHIAQERGYFKEQGLDVELMRFNSTGEQIAALGTGQLAVGVGGVNAALFNAVAGEVPIRIVADKFHARPDYTGLGFMIRSDLLESGKVKTPKDLKGLKIARGQRATANETELVLLLREGGLTLNDIITHDIPYSDIAPALANRSIDGAYAVPPFSHIVESKNFGKMWRPSGTIVRNHQVAVILYSPNFAEKQPDAARGWMIGYLKGVRDFIKAFEKGNPPDDVVAAMLKHGGVKDAAVVRSTPLTPVNPDGFPYIETMKVDLDYFVQSGFVKNPPKLEKVVDRSFADYAVSKLGKYKP